MQKRHRIFIAINLPQEVKSALGKYQQKWHDLPAKWAQEDNLHITLVFLGDLTDIELGQVSVTVKEITQNHNAFEVKLSDVVYGPDRKIPSDASYNKVPRMVWAIGQKSKEMSQLKRDLQEVLLEKVKFAPDYKAFSPHITLARISTFAWRQIEPEERPDINEIIDLNFGVESIEVMESELKKGGPQYTVIESHSFNDSR